MDIVPEEFSDLQRSVALAWRIGGPPEQLQDIDTLLEALADRVAHLLHHDFPRLLNAMYLLDVAEERFNEALAHANPAARARRVAEVILEREIEKARSRERYRRSREGRGPETQNEAPGRLGPGADQDRFPGSTTRTPRPDD